MLNTKEGDQAVRVGFVGLGSQGGPIARQVARAHSLHTWVRREASLASLDGVPFTLCPDLHRLGNACDLVGICVGNDKDVLEVVQGGLLDGMQPGTILSIHSTVHPDVCRSLESLAAPKRIAVLDAPVSGAGSGASNRTLVTIVGGDRAAFARARGVFDTFSGHVHYVGSSGTAQIAKLINNALFMCNWAAAQDALNLGDSLGIDRAGLQAILLSASGSSRAMERASMMTEPSQLAHVNEILRKDFEHIASVVGKERLHSPLLYQARRCLNQFQDNPMPVGRK